MLEYFKTSTALRSVQLEVEEGIDEPYYMNDFLAIFCWPLPKTQTSESLSAQPICLSESFCTI
jgi:hypothetical protein